MSASRIKRPWYCPDQLVEEYRSEGENGGDLEMLKIVRRIQALIVNGGNVAITLLYISAGATNPWVIVTAILTLGLLNGVMAADYKAIVRAIAELNSQNTE